MKKETAFSGLEAAIVLIAFVVVAAVFSYVMLGAGFFATQKSQEVTYSGIKQSTSNLVLDGQIYGDATTITTLTFWLSIPEGGQAQSLATTDLKLLWTKNNEPVQNENNHDGSDAPDKLLEPGEKAKIVFTVPGSYQPGPGSKFTMEIKPKTGAATLISKNLGNGYTGGPIV
jgi:flagellin FlaB